MWDKVKVFHSQNALPWFTIKANLLIPWTNLETCIYNYMEQSIQEWTKLI